MQVTLFGGGPHEIVSVLRVFGESHAERCVRLRFHVGVAPGVEDLTEDVTEFADFTCHKLECVRHGSIEPREYRSVHKDFGTGDDLLRVRRLEPRDEAARPPAAMGDHTLQDGGLRDLSCELSVGSERNARNTGDKDLHEAEHRIKDMGRVGGILFGRGRVSFDDHTGDLKHSSDKETLALEPGVGSVDFGAAEHALEFVCEGVPGRDLDLGKLAGLANERREDAGHFRRAKEVGSLVLAEKISEIDGGE